MIRPLDPATDLPTIARLEAECFNCPWTLDDYRTRFASPGPGGLIYAIRGVAAAYLVFEPSDCGLYVTALGVRPGYRRRGLGRRLMRLLIDRDLPLALHVRHGNAPARSLYRSLGFSDLRREPGFYDDDGEDAVLMIRP